MCVVVGRRVIAPAGVTSSAAARGLRTYPARQAACDAARSTISRTRQPGSSPLPFQLQAQGAHRRVVLLKDAPRRALRLKAAGEADILVRGTRQASFPRPAVRGSNRAEGFFRDRQPKCQPNASEQSDTRVLFGPYPPVQTGPYLYETHTTTLGVEFEGLVFYCAVAQDGLRSVSRARRESRRHSRTTDRGRPRRSAGDVPNKLRSNDPSTVRRR